ncbi:MAG: chlorophyll synthesis pathway protein BchC [Myxococcota bacterium]
MSAGLRTNERRDDANATRGDTLAVVLEAPHRIAVRPVGLLAPGDADVVVDVEWSGISAGTERLLWSGRMNDFPGLGYPLVPGYESVGRVVEAGPASGRRVGERVFVPGSSGFRDVRGLFGGAAARLVVPGARTVEIGPALGDRGVLLALAATAHHALTAGTEELARPGASVERPALIVGHGALGRLLARLVLVAGGPPPVVWERDPARHPGAAGYAVVDPDADPRRDYAVVYDVSGDAALIDALVARLRPNGVLVLAGFYRDPVRFEFAPAFMRNLRLRIAAEWRPEDLAAVHRLVAEGRLDLGGLITHSASPRDADAAYQAAFGDATCIKMVLDWRSES